MREVVTCMFFFLFFVASVMSFVSLVGVVMVLLTPYEWCLFEITDRACSAVCRIDGGSRIV